MPRAAGNKRDYDIAIVDGRGKAVEILAGFPSVTSVIGDCDGTFGDALAGWGYNLGVEGALELVNKGRIKQGDSLKNVKDRLKYARKAPWQRKEDRAEEGTLVHEYAEQLLTSQITYDEILEQLPEQWRGYGLALCKWHEDYESNYLTVAVERTLVSLEHKYAGTTDNISQHKTWDAQTCRVLDYKTSKQVREGHVIQSKAYGLAWSEMTQRLGTPMTVKEIAVVAFHDDGTYDEHTEPFDGADVFLAMLAQYRLRRGGK